MGIFRITLLFALTFIGLVGAFSVFAENREDQNLIHKEKKVVQAEKPKLSLKKPEENRAPAASRKNVKKFRVRKKRTIVPKAQMTIKRIERQTIKIAEPPRKFRRYFEAGTDEAELESVINQEIKQLFNLLKTSKRRDLRLRLGSLYVEKARLIEYRLYEKYDQAMLLFKNKKKAYKPRINLKPTYTYVNKAIKLFETYRRQFPRDKNMDQVLFFLGVSYFKRGQLERGRQRYEALVKKFPKSEYVNDTNFELGEYHFNQSNWKQAAGYYRKIAINRKLRLYSFALYKLAWCRLKIGGQTSRAIANLEAVIREGALQQSKGKIGVSGASRIHFAREALDDLVLFYSHSNKSPGLALSYFRKMSGSSSSAFKMLKNLAYIYLDYGNLKGVRITFKQLIEEAPASLLAYDYQYQIIRAYTYAGSRRIFLNELKHWIVRYGPGSSWAAENSNQVETIQKAFNKMELTVRNYALRMHQSYRKTADQTAKEQALFSYDLYSNHFGKFNKIDEIRFFYAELLFDLRKYYPAAQQYLYVVKNFPNSKYYETASLNSVLTFEKTLPSSKGIRKLVGKKIQFVPFTRPVHDFQKVVYAYVSRFPKKPNVPAILYKMASLHYEFNHHKEALAQFWHLITAYPSSKYTEHSANLILDIYNLTKDFVGLRKAAQRLLSNTVVANSRSAREIRKILSQISLKSAEDLAKNKQYLKSARLYKSFADAHPKSPLRGTAYYNSGVNFKKSGDVLSTLSLYKLALSNGGGKNIKTTILKETPRLYQKTGQYKKAAEAFSLYARSFPGDKLSADFWFNAALIYDGFNYYNQAERAYLEYFKKSNKVEKAQALYLLAELKKRRGQSTQAVSYYNQFLNRGYSNKNALVEAAFKIAEIKKAKRQITESKKWYKRTVNLHKQNGGAGVFYAAQAQFHLIYDTYVQFIEIRIPADSKRQQAVVQKKLNLFNKLKEDLKGVIRFDSGYQVVASLVLIGLASEHMGDSIYNSPLPKGLNTGEMKQYKEGLKKTALPFKTEAVKNYHLAVNRSRKLNAYNEEWLVKAVVRLSDLEKNSPIAVTPFLRRKILPVSLSDWSGI